jgi:PAT family beta-lactamase induction signal transducer AmpG
VNLPGKILGFFAGGIVTATGYGSYFILTVLAIVPATALCLWLWPRFRRLDSTPANGIARA